MKLKSNIVDPYVGQTAEGKKIEFDSIDKVKEEELKVFLFENKDEYIKIVSKEFIAVCPFSGLPDVARIKIEYYPEGGLAIELKSLKYYLVSFKNVGIYQEEVTNKIFEDLKKILKTKKIKITTKYNVRGGLYTTCKVGNV
jgi:7-cyano-7-deazaguanine reductase|tara:strand:+ start:10487 stop:10909 length:423 start_codon:yes stop_codon:yes gene_type:complete